GVAFPPKLYRPDKPLRTGDGSYPQALDYKDFVELEKLRNEKGRPTSVGQVLEYWLEATDNCDYPGPNIGESKHYRVTIEKPHSEKQRQEQERQKAREDQKKHQQSQDQKLEKQKQSEKPQSPQDGTEHGQTGQPENKDESNKQQQQPNQSEKSDSN